MVLRLIVLSWKAAELSDKTDWKLVKSPRRADVKNMPLNKERHFQPLELENTTRYEKMTCPSEALSMVELMLMAASEIAYCISRYYI